MLEGVLASTATSATKRAALATSKGREYIIKVEATAEAALATTAKAVERVARTAKRISAGGVAVGIEARGAKLVKLFLLLGVGEDFVGRLDIGESVLGGGVLVRIGVKLLGEAIIGLLDFGGRCVLVDAESLIWVLGGKLIGGVKGLSEARLASRDAHQRRRAIAYT